MRRTASTQVCLDWWPGRAGIEQWRALNLAAPFLAARFARSSGPRSRLATWLAVEPARTAFDGRLLRGDLGQLLDHGGAGVRGDMTTVCNTGLGPDYLALSGAGYRLVADLSTTPPTLRAIDASSQSGHPGSPHYSDQFADWQAGRYYELPLDRQAAEAATRPAATLQPG